MRKILIIDSVENVQQARDFFAAEGVDLIHARTLGEAEKFLSSKKIDGVISEIFLNHAGSNAEGTEGLVVAGLCRNRGIPCVLTTSFHPEAQYKPLHMQKCEVVRMFERYMAAKVVYLGETKDWKVAWKALAIG
jgi:hypothetical protein